MPHGARPRRFRPSRARARPSQGSQCRPTPGPIGLHCGVSFPAGKGSGRWSPYQSNRGERIPQRLAIGRAPRIGGAHLYSVAPSGISAAQPKVLGAGFHRHGQAPPRALGQHRQRLGTRQMHDVDGGLELLGEADEQGNGLNLGVVGTRAQISGVLMPVRAYSILAPEWPHRSGRPLPHAPATAVLCRAAS